MDSSFQQLPQAGLDKVGWGQDVHLESWELHKALDLRKNKTDKTYKTQRERERIPREDIFKSNLCCKINSSTYVYSNPVVMPVENMEQYVNKLILSPSFFMFLF